MDLEKEYSPSQNTARNPKTVCANFYQILDEAAHKLEIKKIEQVDLDDNSTHIFNSVQHEFDSNNNKISVNRDGNILEILEVKQNSMINNNDNRSKNVIHIFIPGGYWQAMSRYKYRSLATNLASQNDQHIFCLLGYSHANSNPTANIDEMISVVGKGLTHVIQKYRFYKNYNFEISGHSAGAHLLFMAISRLKNSFETSILERITKVNLFSGIYDCRPIVSTSINQPLKWTNDDDNQAWSISPMEDNNFNNFLKKCNISNPKMNINIYVGSYESKEFIRQSRELYQRIKNQKNAKIEDQRGNELVNFFIVENVDHFDLIEKIALDYDYVSRDLQFFR